MRMTHEYLATAPFDLEDLHLFHLLADTGHFTQAAHRAGLTQSSLTRRLQNMEAKLGVTLFDRTTRRVTLTDAGRFLQRESAKLVGNIDAVLKQMAEQYAGARPEVRVGVSRSICLAHLPGLFAANLRHQPEVLTRVVHDDSRRLLEKVEKHELDLAVLCHPERLSSALQVRHRFADQFELIAPRDFSTPPASASSLQWQTHLQNQRWLLLGGSTQTGAQIQRWFQKQGLAVTPFMELDNFDVMVQLVALGMGISLVPQRALATFARKSALQRLPCQPRFERELIVVARKQKHLRAHVEEFVRRVLF